MRTRSQSLAIKKEAKDSTSQTMSKNRKKTKRLTIEAHAESIPIEKRLRGYRSTSTNAIRHRIQRAVNERLYLLATSSTPEEPTRREYRVFGQTGNVYTVIITHLLSCTCPDYMNGNVCKHIIFVLHRVLKVDRRSRFLYQKALLTTELNEIFTSADAQQNEMFNNSNILAERQVREAYQATTGDSNTILDTGVDMIKTVAIVKQKPVTSEDDCPICCESMDGETNDASTILFCATSCGNNIHVTCFEQWRRAKALVGEPVTCPFCRIEWKTATNDEPTSAKAFYTTSGFLNLAAHSTTATNDANDYRRSRYSPPPYAFNYHRYRRYRRRR